MLLINLFRLPCLPSTRMESNLATSSADSLTVICTGIDIACPPKVRRNAQDGHYRQGLLTPHPSPFSGLLNASA